MNQLNQNITYLIPLMPPDATTISQMKIKQKLFRKIFISIIKI